VAQAVQVMNRDDGRDEERPTPGSDFVLSDVSWGGGRRLSLALSRVLSPRDVSSTLNAELSAEDARKRILNLMYREFPPEHFGPALLAYHLLSDQLHYRLTAEQILRRGLAYEGLHFFRGDRLVSAFSGEAESASVLPDQGDLVNGGLYRIDGDLSQFHAGTKLQGLDPRTLQATSRHMGMGRNVGAWTPILEMGNAVPNGLTNFARDPLGTAASAIVAGLKNLLIAAPEVMLRRVLHVDLDPRTAEMSQGERDREDASALLGALGNLGVATALRNAGKTAVAASLGSGASRLPVVVTTGETIASTGVGVGQPHLPPPIPYSVPPTVPEVHTGAGLRLPIEAGAARPIINSDALATTRAVANTGTRDLVHGSPEPFNAGRFTQIYENFFPVEEKPMSLEHFIYDMSIHGLVPKSAGRVLYAGAGTDMKHVLTVTRAKAIVMLSLDVPSYEKLVGYDWDSEQEAQLRYIRTSRSLGYASYCMQDSHFLPCLVAELKSLGLSKDQVEVSQISGGFSLQFKKRFPWQAKEEIFRFDFVRGNALNYRPKAAFDVLYQKAGIGLIGEPANSVAAVHNLLQQMSNGGVLVLNLTENDSELRSYLDSWSEIRGGQQFHLVPVGKEEHTLVPENDLIASGQFQYSGYGYRMRAFQMQEVSHQL